MFWSELHAKLTADAFTAVLGSPGTGSMAFARCLTPDVVDALVRDSSFAPWNWEVRRVADVEDSATRTITADQAVELRESKGKAVLLLVDVERAGAGMDGIYSAAQEVDETILFNQALQLAINEVARRHTPTIRNIARQAVKKARGFGHRYSISPWTEFDFYARIAAEMRHPGELLYLLGLWPVAQDGSKDLNDGLETSRLFVDRLLRSSVTGMTPAQRVSSLRLLNPSDDQIADLERYLWSAATKPLLSALAELADMKQIWVNNLRIEGDAEAIHRIELVPWRASSGRIAKWSGLVEGAEVNDPPVFVLSPDPDKAGEYTKLEIRWTARPENLAKSAVEYRVAIVTDMDEELASRQITHSGKKEEKCRFTYDDFSMLNDDALIGAKAVVSVVGNQHVEAQESDEFIVRFGELSQHESAGVGKKVRTFSEGLIELDSHESVTTLALTTEYLPVDSKGFVLLRAQQHRKSFRVFCPPLLRKIDQKWAEQSGIIGRWRVKVRVSGVPATEPEFIPFTFSEFTAGTLSQSAWTRAANVSRRLAERYAAGSSVGQIYDERSKLFDTAVKDYLLAWATLLSEGKSTLALANTVEIQSLSGKTIGLIVLPSHPLRVAWHSAYDNLVLHTAYEQRAPAKSIRDEFSILDGAMFPAFLPGLEGSGPFVFADMLGFHAVGMVPDCDKEPKAAVAILARALGESETADTVPTIGKQSALILGNEILKYIDCHDTSRILHIHALRPGDGLTMARSLGQVQEQYRNAVPDEDIDEGEHKTGPAFVLELYPSLEQRGVAGRFIAEVREKRRSGAGVLSPEDRWMLESLSMAGGMNLPKLRWARKSDMAPKTAAHIAIAFDTFESQVVPDQPAARSKPLSAYGLLSFFERDYTSVPTPMWRSTVLVSGDGEKHPSDRAHTDRLVRLQQLIGQCVTRSIAPDSQLLPTLQTEISQEKAHGLRELHRLCDWVITLDRNAGVEYFDSPRDNRKIYDAYVIDCVPEREDLGCLQLITSTSNFEEVRNLLDEALDQMGLSRSRRNAEFLMEHLKALSGRLAIRLTGQKAPTSELIALALSQANCNQASEENECWDSLKTGFLIPVDDVLDVISPLLIRGSNETGADPDLWAGRARPDLIYISVVPRKGITFQFIEVKYRRHLRASRNPEFLEGIRHQVQSLRKRWDEWYSNQDVVPSFRAVRRAKLARVLRFYVDKAYRHYLPKERYEPIVAEIDRMIEKGGDYTFAAADRPDRGWVYCPEYAGTAPLDVAPGDWETRIFLFGPGLLPDSEHRREMFPAPAPMDPNGSDTSNGAIAALNRSPTLWSIVDRSDNDAEMKPPLDLLEKTDSLQDAREDLHLTEPVICLGMDPVMGAEVSWPLTIRGNPHLLVAGLPGMGKTTCLLNLCRQMLTAGVCPIVFSYHQDIDEKLAALGSGVRFIDFNGLGFNPLQVIDRESRMAYLDVAGAMRDIFTAIYPELGDIQGERIRKAVKESFIEQGWDDPNANLQALQEPPFGRFLEILRSDPKPDKGLRTLLARLEELNDYGFFASAENEESLWESTLPIVIRIHSTQNDNLQKAFASLVFYGLYKDMFRRGLRERITHAVVFDEAHRAARLQLIPTMAKECRKYGVSLVLASQEARDFHVSLFSAIANYLVLRLNESDAKALVRNVASSDQERVLVDKIKQMDRFKALYFSEGRKRPAAVALLG